MIFIIFFSSDTAYDFYLEDSDGPINMKELLDMGAILFPYKVAKALDPDIYRNIDFDNWVDTLRGNFFQIMNGFQGNSIIFCKIFFWSSKEEQLLVW